jgi:hypothetical protein
VGLFSKLFGGQKSPERAPEAEPEPARDPRPDAIVVLRRGMNLPDSDYVAQVVATLFPDGLPAEVPRVGLSQPSWFKTEEVADSIAAGVVETFAARFSLAGATSRRRALAGPDGCQILVVELYRG